MTERRSWQSRIVMPGMWLKARFRRRLTISQARQRFHELQATELEQLQRRFPALSGSRLPTSTPCELLKTDEAQSEPTIMYFHGGGFVMGSIATHRRLAVRLSWSCKCPVAVFDYRLAPEHPFPAALDDACTVFYYLSELAGSDPSRIVFGGDSAGGGLLLATLLKLKQRGCELPRAAFLLSPWLDLTLAGKSILANRVQEVLLRKEYLKGWARAYGDGSDLSDPLLSPLYGDLQGLPQMLIQVGNGELLLDDSCTLAERMRSIGGKVQLEVWKNVPHVWHMFSHWLPEGKNAIQRIAQFLSSCT